MKVKFTLEEEESKTLRQAIETIPTDLCDYIACPQMDGNACENCPMATIQQKWMHMHLDIIIKEILPMIKELEE